MATKRHKPHHHLYKILFVIIIATLAAYLWSGRTKDRLFSPTRLNYDNMNTAYLDDWISYKNEDFGYSLSYPQEFSLTEDSDTTRISSSPILCETDVSGVTEKVSVSEIDVQLKPYTGRNFQEIWKNNFGSLFTNTSYDGKITIDDKRGYFLLTGGESTTSKQTILVNQARGKALEIIIRLPFLVHGCESSMNLYPHVPQKILSSIKFQ